VLARAREQPAYCAQFGLTGADQQKKVGVLSGGETQPRAAWPLL